MKPANTDRNVADRRWIAVSRGLFALTVFLGCAPLLCAQNGDATDSESLQGRLLYRTDEGAVVPLEDILIDERRIEQVVRWLTTQEYVPRYDTIITASGRVARGQARIHAELQIEVHTEDEWVLVPVGFQSWTIENFQHAPDQAGFESRFSGNATGRREWYLRGKGSHTLSMDLIGDVRDPEADRQRLKLSVPNSVKSSLQLTFDQPVRNVRGNIGNQSPVTTSEEGSTVVFYGLEQETEITWESTGTTGDRTTVITAPEPAEMTLDLTSSTAGLKCKQMINVTDGAVQQLSVRLPPGYSYTAITGTDDTGNRIVKSDDVTTVDGVSTAEVVFTRPVRRQIQLEYDLRRGDTKYPQTIVVSVPEIEGVVEQSGKVDILIPRGLNVSIPPVPLTQRVRVEQQPNLQSEATAYELLSTEASLQVRVSEQEARYSVLPRLEFSTEDQSLLLRARFQINVSSGSLNELNVRWQNFARDSWQIVPGTVFLKPDKGSRRELSHDTPDGSTLHLLLDNFQSGIFFVEFQAFRDLISADDDPSGGSFFLPDVVTAARHETIVSLVESDMYSLSLFRAHDRSTFDMVPSQSQNTSDSSGRTTTWLVNDSGSRVRVEPSQQTREVSSSAVVGLDTERDSIQVHTTVDINVRHRDLNELNFTAFDNVIPILRLDDSPEALPLPERDGDEFVWQLAEPMRGQHTLSLHYLWRPQREAEHTELPLVLPSSGLESLIIGTRIPDVISVVHDEMIRPFYQRQFAAAWHSDQALSGVKLRIPQALSHHQTQPPSICLVETQIGPVNITTRTTLFYESAPGSVLFSVPTSAGVEAKVNGVRTDAPRTELGEQDSGEIRRVSVPRSATEDTQNAVIISLTCQNPRGPHHHLLSTETPVYPRIVGPPEWLTTVWLVDTLDDDRLVAMDPDLQFMPGAAISETWWSTPEQRLPAAIATALSGLPENVRSRFQEHYNSNRMTKQPSLAFIAGPQLQTAPVLIYSRSMGWVIAAGLGILLYTSLVTLQQQLKLIAAVALPACVLIWGLLPQQVLSLLTPMLPAVGAAVAAWAIRLLLMPSRSPRRSRHQRRSVFAATSRSQSASSVTESLDAVAPISGAEPAIQ